MINIEENTKAKPFLKWAGGKKQLLKEIENYYPFKDSKMTKYVEPLVGGGAVLFDILNKYDLKEVYISDTCAELINTYRIIKSQVNSLLKLLKEYQTEYLLLSIEEKKAYYNLKRDKFNSIKLNMNEESNKENIEKAALMIFLNKTCFNGLYRVNSKGKFNVPMGAYKNPLICDEINLKAVSKKLQKVTIIYGEYIKSLKFIDENTFVYIDPPYRPLNKTSYFTAYNENLFTDHEQIELVNFINTINNKKAKVLISNSDPKNVDENDSFFDELYKNYNIKRVKATRMINSKKDSRGKINELLISNFQVEEDVN